MSSDSDRSIYNLLPIPLLILCLLYLMIAGLAVKRYCSFSKAQYIGMLGKLFYGLMFIETLIRTVSFILLGLASMGVFENKSDGDKVYDFMINIIFIPEFLIWISCTLLFWQYLIMFYISHINFSISSKTNDALPVPLRNKFFNLMIFLIIIFMIIQAVFVVLFNTGIFGMTMLFYEDLIINYTLPVVALITQFILHLRFSGAPYVSPLYQEKKEKMTKIIVYWIVARVLNGTFTVVFLSLQGDIVNDFTDDSEQNKNQQSIQLLEIIIFFINYFFCEIFAFTLTINKGVSKIFQLYQYVNPLKDANILLLQENSNPFEASMRKKTNECEETNEIPINLDNLFQNIDLSKLVYDNNYVNPHHSNNKFGTIKKAYYFSKPVAIRTIEIDNVSNFIIEEIQEDMANLIKLDWKQIVPIKGLYYDQKKVILMNDFLEDLSLESYISQPPNLLINNEDPKMKIALEIANNLKYMHENNIIHGHLTPNNIFITKEIREPKAKIVDCGFRGLKKLASLQKGYCNKSKYTAPEHLKEKNLIVKSFNKGSDIYSFGIILWELIENKKAFENLNIKELSLYVVERQSRPKISEVINENLSQLIRACWQEEVEKRPNFKVICKILEQNIN